MNTVGNTPKTKITREESYCLAISFPVKDGETLKKGNMAKFHTDGSLTFATSTTRPLGVVTKGSKERDQRATVLTQFVAEVTAESDDAILVGALVTVDDAETDVWKTAASGDYAMGVALNATAAAGAELIVGVLRTPEKLA